MTVQIDYKEERWDNQARFGVAGVHAGRPWEACIVCGRRLFTDEPYLLVEISWKNNEAMTADDPPEHSQGCFPIGRNCLRANPQLKPHVREVRCSLS